MYEVSVVGNVDSRRANSFPRMVICKGILVVLACLRPGWRVVDVVRAIFFLFFLFFFFLLRDCRESRGIKSAELSNSKARFFGYKPAFSLERTRIYSFVSDTI